MSQLEYTIVAVVQASMTGFAGVCQLALLKWIYQQSKNLSLENPIVISERKQLSAKLKHLFKGSRQFFRHKVSLSGICLAMLYLTV